MYDIVCVSQEISSNSSDEADNKRPSLLTCVAGKGRGKGRDGDGGWEERWLKRWKVERRGEVEMGGGRRGGGGEVAEGGAVEMEGGKEGGRGGGGRGKGRIDRVRQSAPISNSLD